MDKNLALIALFAGTFMFQDCKNEELINKLADYIKGKGIDAETYFDDIDMSMEEALNWFITTTDKLQDCIEEYEALERED